VLCGSTPVCVDYLGCGFNLGHGGGLVPWWAPAAGSRGATVILSVCRTAGRGPLSSDADRSAAGPRFRSTNWGESPRSPPGHISSTGGAISC
jgi:hypothetical protein